MCFFQKSCAVLASCCFRHPIPAPGAQPAGTGTADAEQQDLLGPWFLFASPPKCSLSVTCLEINTSHPKQRMEENCMNFRRQGPLEDAWIIPLKRYICMMFPTSFLFICNHLLNSGRIRSDFCPSEAVLHTKSPFSAQSWAETSYLQSHWEPKAAGITQP